MRFKFILAVPIVLCAAIPAFAQPVPSKAPDSTHIFPAGGRVGTIVNVRVGAECIPPAGTNFSLVGQGVSAPDLLVTKLADTGEPSPRRRPTEIPINYPKEWQSKVTIAADAPAGVAYWRISCATGGTGSRPFVIGTLSEFIETESNSTAQRAEKVAMPLTINGQISGERDIDYFRFSADAGDVVVAEVLAGRLGSPLDPVVEILGPDRRRVRTETAHVGADPVLACLVESAGEYLLRISHIDAHGGPSFVYRINLSTKPFVRFAFPSGGRAGTEQDVELFAMSGTETPAVLQEKIHFPETGRFTHRRDNSGAVTFDVDDLPNVVETEPNDARETASALAPPVTVNGRFLKKTDEDWFSFTAKKDEQLTITCRAFPPGTPALPDLALLDSSGKTLVTARSVESKTRDIHVEWQAPADGEYRLRLRDLCYGAQGGAEFIYRLSVKPAQPDFALAIASDCLNSVQGGSAKVTVSVTRFGRFDGPVELSFAGLPEGVKTDNPQIPAGKNAVAVTLSSTEDVPAASYTLRVTGQAKIGDETVERVARTGHLGIDALGASVESPTLDRLHLTLQHKPVFRLFCLEYYHYVRRGTIYPYPMEVERLNGFDGPITLQICDRQNRDLDGVQMLEAVIPPGENTVDLPIYLPETMHINIQSQTQLYAQAYATFLDKQGRKQSALVVASMRNMIRTQPTVVKLKTVDKLLTGKAGGTVTCHVRLQRTTNFTGPMELKLLEPAAAQGFSAEPVQIAAGHSEAQIAVQVSAEREPGTVVKLKFRATGILESAEPATVVTEVSVPFRFE